MRRDSRRLAILAVVAALMNLPSPCKALGFSYTWDIDLLAGTRIVATVTTSSLQPGQTRDFLNFSGFVAEPDCCAANGSFFDAPVIGLTNVGGPGTQVLSELGSPGVNLQNTGAVQLGATKINGGSNLSLFPGQTDYSPLPLFACSENFKIAFLNPLVAGEKLQFVLVWDQFNVTKVSASFNPPSMGTRIIATPPRLLSFPSLLPQLYAQLELS